MVGPSSALTLLILLASHPAEPAPAPAERSASLVTEVAPIAAKVAEPEFPRGVFWARGASLIPLVCITEKGGPLVAGAACRKVLPAPFRGLSVSGEVRGQKWVTQPVHEVGHATTALVTARAALGVGDDQQQEASFEQCLVAVPASAPLGLRVFPVAAPNPAELTWDLGPLKLHLEPGKYRGKRPHEKDAQALNQVVSEDGKLIWDGSQGAEEVGFLGAVDLLSTGAPLVVVHQRMSELGGDRVTVLDANLHRVAALQWSLYSEPAPAP